ncbi:MAG: type III-A CRISPR-associated protein Cas10/Csm1 [Deltaproteobacteria bacterium]|nr:MAG: type III-A CRISPR-associated protein Cas10/Csm1 [Deltaproteobacteria bacterium]
MDERSKLVLAALLHDIGKFYQRTGREPLMDFRQYGEEDLGPHGAHAKWSASFIKEVLPEDMLEVAWPVLYHHNPSKSGDEIAALVQKADHLSSAERKKGKGEGPQKELLIPVLGTVGKEWQTVEHRYGLNVLRLDKDSIFPQVVAHEDPGAIKESYGNLWEQFVEEVRSIGVISYSDVRYFVNNLLSILYKYTWCIPSATYGVSPDISLYDHLRITAAIALSLYDSKNGKVSLIGGDLSGIQSFIYKLASPREAQAGMAKRLRGRSFYLSLLVETVAAYVLDSLNLPLTNLLWSSGGHFLILAPAIDGFVDELRGKLDKWFFEKFNGDLVLLVSEVVTEADDLAEFSRVYEKLGSEMQIAKQRKFSGLEEWPVSSEEEVTGVCAVCGRGLKDGNAVICEDCQEHEKIGQKLPYSHYLVLTPLNEQVSSQIFSVDMAEFGRKWLFIDEEHYDEWPQNSAVYVLNSSDYPWATSHNAMFFVPHFLAKHVPHGKYGVLTFDEMEARSTGAKFLAALRMDVDNLGRIFIGEGASGEPLSMSRIGNLSRDLDLFFSGYLNKIAEKYNTMYVLYAGGDDVFLIGAWDECVKAALDIRNEFREYTCGNENLTISGGISIFKSGFPVGRAAEMSGRNLDIAKGHRVLSPVKREKDSLYLFGKSLFWDEAEKSIEFAEDLVKRIEQKDGDSLSRRFIYTLLEIYRTNFEEEGKVRLSWIPMFLYHLTRNVRYELKEGGETKVNPFYVHLEKNIRELMPFAMVWASHSLLKTRK